MPPVFRAMKQFTKAVSFAATRHQFDALTIAPDVIPESKKPELVSRASCLVVLGGAIAP